MMEEYPIQYINGEKVDTRRTLSQDELERKKSHRQRMMNKLDARLFSFKENMKLSDGNLSQKERKEIKKLPK